MLISQFQTYSLGTLFEAKEKWKKILQKSITYPSCHDFFLGDLNFDFWKGKFFELKFGTVHIRRFFL